ncbi:TnpV protein [Ethanoligenens sp.]|uniref:TnpV protein n=1 Tax=Ethanoligenens sp. TaxID=2099655 RepID=UPI0039E9B3B2
MENKTKNRFGITYTQNGDYLIPDIVMDPQPEGTIGIYGRARKRYLKEYHGILYTRMVAKCNLKAHLLEIDQEAQEMQDRIVEQMKKQRGITEQLKANDQMRWVGEMNNILASAREMVMHDLIYV